MSDSDGDESSKPKKKYNDFDCPNCNANNPYDDGITDGAEIRCYYCGQEYRVRIEESGKMKLREI